MTPKQKEIAKQKAELDTELLTKLLTWFTTESGHPGFSGMSPPAQYHKPTVIEDPENENNLDSEHNPEVEHQFDGATFHFTSGHDPAEDTSVYGSTQNFIVAMLQRTMPTLLVQGGNYASLKELLLEDVCPVQFPFGLGGPKMNRRNRISTLEGNQVSLPTD